jgi:hypothetical protein
MSPQSSEAASTIGNGRIQCYNHNGNEQQQWMVMLMNIDESYKIFYYEFMPKALFLVDIFLFKKNTQELFLQFFAFFFQIRLIPILPK